MAKKANTATKKVEKKVAPVEKISTVDIENAITDNIADIVEKMETIQPTEEIVNAVMVETPEVAQEIIENELSKIEDIKKEVENKINEVIAANPSVKNIMKKSNAAFTNMWNGMLVE